MGELVVEGFEVVAEGVYLEGLAVDFARGAVWYSDVIAGGIHGVMKDGTRRSFNEDRMWTGGVLMNADGAVLSSGPGGIMWNDPDSGRSGWLLQKIDGEPINGVNEMVPDGTGGIFFGTNDIERVIAAQDTRPTALYRLTVDRKVIKLADGIGFSNGLMFDAERRAFYCSDTFACAWAWDVAPDLSLINKRRLLDKGDCDGMALDESGNVWITGFRSNGFLTCVTPEGDMLSPFETPEGSTTQIRFGGSDLRDVYLNIVPSDGGDSLKEGKALSGRSTLYRGRSRRPGQAVGTAGFRLAD